MPHPLREGLLGPRVVSPHPQGLQGSHLNLSQASAQRHKRYFLLNNKAVNSSGACQPRFVDAALRKRPPRRNRRRRATRSRQQDCPRRECVPPRRYALRDSADGTRLERRIPRKHGWHPWRGARLRKVGHGSPRNSIANTRAPPRLWWARCGRTSTSVIVPRRAA